MRYRKGATSQELKAARKASLITRSGHIEPSQLVLGAAMVSRGEFSFIIANLARQTLYTPSGLPDRYLLSEDAYAVTMWALLISTISAPLMLRWATRISKKAGKVATDKKTRGLLGSSPFMTSESETSFTMNMCALREDSPRAIGRERVAGSGGRGMRRAEPRPRAPFSEHSVARFGCAANVRAASAGTSRGW